MKQLSIVCIVGLLFAVFVPFSLSFPSPDEAVETNEVVPLDKEETSDVPAPINEQTSEKEDAPVVPDQINEQSDAVPNPDYDDPSPDAAPETTSEGLEVTSDKEDTPVVPEQINQQSDATAVSDSEAPSQDSTSETTSEESEAPQTTESTPNQEVASHGNHIVGIRVELSCGKLKCPPGSVSCVFTKKTTEDLKFVESNSTCLAENGEVLYSVVDKVPNQGNSRISINIANSVKSNTYNASASDNSNQCGNAGNAGHSKHCRHAHHSHHSSHANPLRCVNPFHNPIFNSPTRIGDANIGNFDPVAFSRKMDESFEAMDKMMQGIFKFADSFGSRFTR